MDLTWTTSASPSTLRIVTLTTSPCASNGSWRSGGARRLSPMHLRGRPTAELPACLCNDLRHFPLPYYYNTLPPPARLQPANNLSSHRSQVSPSAQPASPLTFPSPIPIRCPPPILPVGSSPQALAQFDQVPSATTGSRPATRADTLSCCTFSTNILR